MRRLSWRAAYHQFRRQPRNVAATGYALTGLSGRGFGRYLMQRLPPDVLRGAAVEILGRDRVVIEFERDGLRWHVDTVDDVGKQLFVEGHYQGEEVAALVRWLGGRKGTVLDVGANVGTTSIPFAQAGYQVIAVEPVPEVFSMLRDNVERNGLSDRVTCVQRAITAIDGSVDMWAGVGSGHGEVAVEGVTPYSGQFGGGLVRVPSGPMSSLVEDPSDVVLVWADVQGCETDVIETGETLWKAGVPIFLEVAPHLLDLHGGTDHFTKVVESHFGSYITRHDLKSAPREQPIGQFGRYVSSLAGTVGDALLIP